VALLQKACALCSILARGVLHPNFVERQRHGTRHISVDYFKKAHYKALRIYIVSLSGLERLSERLFHIISAREAQRTTAALGRHVHSTCRSHAELN
jgi:hypothetical protein